MTRQRGGRHKHQKKKGFNNNRELVYRDAGQEYAQILKLLGSGRMKVHCFDEKERIAKVRGKFRKRVWVNIGDIVLVQKSEDTQDDSKCYIVHVFYYDEVKKLKQMGELPKDLKVAKKTTDDQGINIEFGDGNEQEEQQKVEKPKKQNLEDFMPNSSSEDESDEEKPQKPKPQKEEKIEKEESEEDSEESEEEKENDSSESEEDELADI